MLVLYLLVLLLFSGMGNSCSGIDDNNVEWYGYFLYWFILLFIISGSCNTGGGGRCY